MLRSMLLKLYTSPDTTSEHRWGTYDLRPVTGEHAAFQSLPAPVAKSVQ